MNRYLTAYTVETGIIEAFTEEEVDSLAHHPSEWADDWVWQFAPDKETACAQHDEKMDEWEMDPEKHTY